MENNELTEIEAEKRAAEYSQKDDMPEDMTDVTYLEDNFTREIVSQFVRNLACFLPGGNVRQYDLDPENPSRIQNSLCWRKFSEKRISQSNADFYKEIDDVLRDLGIEDLLLRTRDRCKKLFWKIDGIDNYYLRGSEGEKYRVVPTEAEEELLKELKKDFSQKDKVETMLLRLVYLAMRKKGYSQFDLQWVGA